MDIYVFATSVNRDKDAQNIANMLSNYFDAKSVSFDLDDYENILRIEGDDLSAEKIEEALSLLGHKCRELV